MAAPRKYSEELRERAIRMAVDLRRDPATRSGVLRRVGEQLAIDPETSRNWVSQVEIDRGQDAGGEDMRFTPEETSLLIDALQGVTDDLADFRDGHIFGVDFSVYVAPRTVATRHLDG